MRWRVASDSAMDARREQHDMSVRLRSDTWLIRLRRLQFYDPLACFPAGRRMSRTAASQMLGDSDGNHATTGSINSSMAVSPSLLRRSRRIHYGGVGEPG